MLIRCLPTVFVRGHFDQRDVERLKSMLDRRLGDQVTNAYIVATITPGEDGCVVRIEWHATAGSAIVERQAATTTAAIDASVEELVGVVALDELVGAGSHRTEASHGAEV